MSLWLGRSLITRGGRYFDRQSVTPAVFANSNGGNTIPQLAVGIAVEHARRRINAPICDTANRLQDRKPY
jgi:hypothetical protein